MNLHTKEWDSLLYALVDGAIEPQQVLTLLKAVTDKAHKEHITKVLIDGRMVSGTLTDNERMLIAHEMAEYAEGLKPKVWVAFVGRYPSFTGQGVRIAQKLGYNLDLFSNVDEAITWLARAPHSQHNSKWKKKK